MLTSPFPSADSEYELQDTGGQFLLTYKDGSADVSTTMTKDTLITEIKVVTPEFTSSVRPRLVRNQKGLVLSGYTADYVPTKGPGKVKLNVQIDYQEVKGLQLPRKLHVNSTYDDAPNQMELWFSDYQVRTR